MKLNARDARAWLTRPPSDAPATLIYGEDAMRVALKRQDFLAALLGPNAEDEMRLTRIAAGDLRREPLLLADAIKAQGFFPGPRAALVEDATPQHGPAILSALEDWRPGDAHVVVAAGAQKPTSALRKGFEKHGTAGCIAVYDDPPGRDEIEEMLTAVGLAGLDRDRVAELQALALTMGPGDLRQLVEKLALYKHGDAEPVTSDDIAAVAPASTEAELDEVLAALAEARAAAIAPLLSRLAAQGVPPVQLAIGATRHFRTLLTAASDPGGPGQGVGRLRPPVYGPRRDALLRQAQHWGRHRLEDALSVLTELDLTLRTSPRAPQMALTERAFIRVSMMGTR